MKKAPCTKNQGAQKRNRIVVFRLAQLAHRPEEEPSREGRGGALRKINTGGSAAWVGQREGVLADSYEGKFDRGGRASNIHRRGSSGTGGGEIA